MANFETFNNHAELFLKRMEETFPDETKIRVYRQKFDMVRTINSRKPVEMFMYNMLPYGEKILSRDETFFKQDEFVNNAESISGKMGLIKYWDTMNPKTKDSIWEFIQGLYILGMGSLGLQEDLQTMIAKTGFKA